MADIVTMHTNVVAKYVNGGKLAQLDDLTQYDDTFSYDNYPEGVTKLYIWRCPLRSAEGQGLCRARIQ